MADLQPPREAHRELVHGIWNMMSHESPCFGQRGVLRCARVRRKVLVQCGQNLGIAHANVVHKNMQFVKKISRPKKRPSQRSDTQMLHGQWKLKKYVPLTLPNKAHACNDRVMSYMSWMWRANDDVDLWKAAKALCRAME